MPPPTVSTVISAIGPNTGGTRVKSSACGWTDPVRPESREANRRVVVVVTA
jgi:hypothetical protein